MASTLPPRTILPSTILVADDNRANREALASLLEAAGYEVLRASDGAEALEMARERRPDAVISDVLMPRMDGYELARHLRDDPGTRSIGLVFYTAYFGQPQALDLAHAHGVARVLVKPADNEAILRTVRDALASRPLAAAEAPAELDREHLRVLVDELLRKTSALEAQQRRIERLNRTLSMLSAVNALIVRVQQRQELLDEACWIAVETGGFQRAIIALAAEGSAAPLQVASCGQGEGESKAVLPLGGAGEPAGTLTLHARQRDFFDEDEMRLLQELAGDITFALRHLAQKARMDYLAYHDSLTGLPNRSLFADRLAQALSAAKREKRLAAVVALDVQRFRILNETLGRKTGDELLRQIAARLRGVARDEDTVARVGGDHFAVAIAGFDRLRDAARVLVDAVEEAFAQPLDADGEPLRVALRAGVAVYPGDGETADALNVNAEAALSRAKATGQRYLFYTADMNERVAESLAMETRLRLALEGGRLALHYQPKMDMLSGDLVGLEALIRWDDAELGPVPPSRFVALMEETGLILAAGRWALGRAVEDIRRWQAMGLSVPRTSVNVSALQLRQGDFVESVLKAISGDALLLDLEITESVLVDDIEDSTRKLQILRRAGVQVSVDDFGTGYSSLNYLARLPVDTLKIDRSFVMRMRDAGYPRNIVAMIVSLAHTLGLKVIAEGVEEDEQRRMLGELGCDQIQGFLVSRPLPADQIGPLLKKAA